MNLWEVQGRKRRKTITELKYLIPESIKSFKLKSTLLHSLFFVNREGERQTKPYTQTLFRLRQKTEPRNGLTDCEGDYGRLKEGGTKNNDYTGGIPESS